METQYRSPQWEMAEEAMGTGAACLLWGPPGTGKSYVARHIGQRKKALNVTLTPDTPAAELRGHYIVGEDGAFHWHNGPAVSAWLAGIRLSVDEIGEAAGDALTFLYSICDDPDSAQMTLPNGDTINPKKGFQMVATTNEEPTVLPDALRDRFLIFKITDPHPGAINSLPEPWRDLAWETARINSDRRVSVRRFHQMVRLVDKGVQLPRAMTMALGRNRANALRDSVNASGLKL